MEHLSWAVARREVVNTILYVSRAGVQWRYLPHDFPDWQSVYSYFRQWKKDGTLKRLRREQEGEGPQVERIAEQSGLQMEVVERSDPTPGFVVQPKRWIVERTFGWLIRRRSPPKRSSIWA